jgi:signal transduction histidine kinase
MAHELRTPLSGVRAEAELAMRDPSDQSAVGAALERIVAATDRMATVIQTLLATARGQNGSTRLTCEAAVPVGEVVAAMRPAADAHGVRIAVHMDHGTAVAADSGMVAQAFQPLLDNAISHAASAVDVAVEPGPGAVVVAVEDDGRGFDVAEPEGLFAPGRSSTGGAGLGLPLARRLARAMGGDVVAVARPAGGARFELRLPRG